MNAETIKPWRFVCGTKAAWQRGPGDYRVSCATCGAGGTVKHPTKEAAMSAATRDSAQACTSCGAS